MSDWTGSEAQRRQGNDQGGCAVSSAPVTSIVYEVPKGTRAFITRLGAHARHFTTTKPLLFDSIHCQTTNTYTFFCGGWTLKVPKHQVTERIINESIVS